VDRHEFGSDGLRVAVKAVGGELCSLRDGGGTELLWQAGPEGPRHSPILFPIVGELKDERLILDGRSYTMRRHGVIRERRFEWVERRGDGCRLRIVDDPETRAAYPFAFRFDVDYMARGTMLEIRYVVTNPGGVDLPFSVGAHPAFRWPLRPGLRKEDHRLVFERPEPAPIRRLNSAGLLKREPVPTPIEGRELRLSPDLFRADAVVLDRLESGHVSYLMPEGGGLEVSWEGFPQLGIWSKPEGAEFLCIEPWCGYASPADFDGDFRDKPGLLHLAPGEQRTFIHRMRLV